MICFFWPFKLCSTLHLVGEKQSLRMPQDLLYDLYGRVRFGVPGAFLAG